jgi:hypothetical protein
MIEADEKFADGLTPDLHPAQIEAYRRMIPAQKMRQASRLYWQARKFKKAGLQMQHPDWSEEQIEEETRRIFLYASTP